MVLNRWDKPFFVFLFLFLMIIPGVTGCLPVQETPVAPIPTELHPEAVPLEFATIVFNLIIPDALPQSDVIYIDVLDEVTGLTFNPKRTQLNQVDSTHYSITLTVIKGAVIKYRYYREGGFTAIEKKTDGSNVRYRMAYAASEQEYVNDYLASWGDNEYAGKTGTLSGFVKDGITAMPVADILICAGGYQTFTDANGQFVLDGLMPGTHNIAAYAIDGSYLPFVQGAAIVEDLDTPAQILLRSTPIVNLTFLVTPPQEAIGAPVRMAGNLYQTGNMFADLAGGVNALASRMPILAETSDGKLMLILQLHSGTYFTYKYTLGDGLWNAEQSDTQPFVLREMIVPEKDTFIEDTILRWSQPGIEPFTFQVSTPSASPQDESLSIQFNPFSWTEPIPMWSLGGNQWLYILFSPLDIIDTVEYRYCRNDHCEETKYDATTTSFSKTQPNRLIIDIIPTWINWQPEPVPTSVIASNIPKKGAAYLTGFALSPINRHDQLPQFSKAITDSTKIGGNFFLLTLPHDIVQTANHVRFVQPSGQRFFVREIEYISDTAHSLNSLAGISPTIRFDKNQIYDLDEAEWFAELSRTAISYAHIAEVARLDTLVLSHDLLFRFLQQNESISMVESLVSEVRAVYSGNLAYQLAVDEIPTHSTAFLNRFDSIIVIIDESSFDQNDLALTQQAISDLLTQNIALLRDNVSANIIMAIAPSQAQVSFFNLSLKSIITQEWVDGIIINDYYPWLATNDMPTSIYAKPAMDVVWYWYAGVKQ